MPKNNDLLKSGNKKGLTVALTITIIFMVVEIVGGLLTNSLALAADGIHMLADVVALSISLLALKMMNKKPSLQKSYGYGRIEVLASFVNCVTLIIFSGFIIWWAIDRFTPQEVIDGFSMTIIALAGLLANLASVWALIHYGETDKDINMRGAYLHVVSDAAGSVGAIAAGFLMYYFSWFWTDSLISIFVSLLILRSTWGLLLKSFNILMEAAPTNINIDEVFHVLQNIEGIAAIHDLHIWSLTSDRVILTMHASLNDSSNHLAVLEKIQNILCQNYSIDHSTIQLDNEQSDCNTGLCDFYDQD
ncbi:MAG: cation diffusion facilitator family transporter [Acidaminococcaceae bacterium]